MTPTIIMILVYLIIWWNAKNEQSNNELQIININIDIQFNGDHILFKSSIILNSKRGKIMLEIYKDK